MRVFLFRHPTLPSVGHSCVPMNTTLFNIVWFSYQGTSRDIVYQTLVLIFVVNIRPARTLWNSTHSPLSPFTPDWSRNLLHIPMQNMAVNNISYIIYPLSMRIEKGYTTKMIPFFFCSVYLPGLVMRDNALFHHFLTSNNFPLWSALGMQLFVTDRGTSVVLFGK